MDGDFLHLATALDPQWKDLKESSREGCLRKMRAALDLLKGEEGVARDRVDAPKPKKRLLDINESVICNLILDIFTSNYNPNTRNQNPTTEFLESLRNQSLCICTFFVPPLPHISYHSPQTLLAIVNNAICGHKTQMRKISFFHMDQNRFRIRLTEKIYKISLC